jgi:hypothetical protein
MAGEIDTSTAPSSTITTDPTPISHASLRRLEARVNRLISARSYLRRRRAAARTLGVAAVAAPSAVADASRCGAFDRVSGRAVVCCLPRSEASAEDRSESRRRDRCLGDAAERAALVPRSALLSRSALELDAGLPGMTGIGAVSASGSTARGGSITAVVSVLGGRRDRCAAAPDARRPSEGCDACRRGAVASSGCAAGSSRGGRGDRRAAMRAAALS